MDAPFGHNRWQTNQTGWCEHNINPLFIAHFPLLNVPPGKRVFVPLCGESLDLGWLLCQGYAIAGAELREFAVTQRFAELGMETRISKVGQRTLFHGEKIDIFAGDLFALSHEILSPFDAVDDQVALVALPETMRNRYTAHLNGKYPATELPHPTRSATRSVVASWRVTRPHRLFCRCMKD
jgi:thiopurine S-methyltransferase